MKKKMFLKGHSLILCYAFFLLLPANVLAQVSRTSELFVTMKKMDSLLFDEGFNNCNSKVLESILAEDLEFYHDLGGMQNKKEFVDAMRINICSNPNGKITRRLVPGTEEVYELLKNGVVYGAIQNCIHEFYIQEPGKQKHITGIAKGSCLWLLQNGEWKLKRVFSYDHKAATKPMDAKH